MKKLVLAFVTVCLCGCPASPKRINVENGNERQLSCQELAAEIAAAKQANVEAHAQDKFRFSDIFPPTGVVSVYRIWRAGDAAIDREQLLNKLYNEKGCAQMQMPYSSNNEGYIVVAQYFSPQESQEMQMEQQPASTAGLQHNNPPPAANAVPDTAVQEDDDPLTNDQSQDVYIKNGYDSEVFPHKDPKHFVF